MKPTLVSWVFLWSAAQAFGQPCTCKKVEPYDNDVWAQVSLLCGATAKETFVVYRDRSDGYQSAGEAMIACRRELPAAVAQLVPGH